MDSVQRLAACIAEEIKAGKLGASGAIFPPQAILQKEYGVSNSTLVAVRKKLEEIGLIETIGRSAFVTNGRARFNSPYMQRKKVTGRIGVIVPNFDSLFFGAFCDEISKWLRKKGYGVICVGCPEGGEQDILQTVKRAGVDGIVAAVSDRKHIISMYERVPLPCVLVGARGESLRLSTVDEDPFDAAKRIGMQLAAEGCQSFFVLRTAKYSLSNDQRLTGFLEGLGEAGASVPEENIITIDVSLTAAVRGLVHKIRSAGKKAGVLIYNFVGLPVFLEQCRINNLYLQRDMEVASFLDVHGSSQEQTMITVAKTSVRDLVVCAGREIIRQITDDTAAPQAFKIPYHIHWNGIEPK